MQIIWTQWEKEYFRNICSHSLFQKEKKYTKKRFLNATFLFGLAHSFKIYRCIYFAGQTIASLFLAEKEDKKH